MKKVSLTLVMSTLFGMAVLADAAEKTKTVDPSGTWRWERERDNGETVKHQLKLEKNKKNEVVGTYYGLIDGLKSKKGTIEGDKLKLEFDVERDGYAFQAEYIASIKGDKASGTINISSDQGSREMPWEAKRSVELSDVVGKWKLEVETPEGDTHEPTLTISEKDKKFSAEWYSEELGEFDVSDLKAKGKEFTFIVTGEIDGNEFVAKCTTHPKGSKLHGKVDLEIADEELELEVAGKRAAAKEKKKKD